MTFEVEVSSVVPGSADVTGLPVVVADGQPALPGEVAAAAGIEEVSLRAHAVRADFTAGRGQAIVIHAPAGGPTTSVLLGLGPVDAVDSEAWRRAGAALVRSAGNGDVAVLRLPVSLTGVGPSEIGAAVAEGAVLAAYRFDAYRTSPPPAGISKMIVVPELFGSGSDGALSQVAEGVRRGRLRAQAVVFARDLINCPPSDLPPRVLAERASAHLSTFEGVGVEVWDRDRIISERLGGLLGVSRGSAEPPRLIRATYVPASRETTEESSAPLPHVVLVGKGITFDSGGLSLKTADGMTTMKTDMSGAAIVLAAVSACAGLEIPVRVTALAASAENMPGGRALKPGDVLTVRNGSTIEVLNTDAEGRLVLADALALAAEIEPTPDAVIDVATLTGAATVALGTGIGALFGNDQSLIDRVRRAGDVAGERLWPMPLPEDYAEHIDSDVADMKNVGRAGQAGAIAAAHLLARFTRGMKWAHLDIAGPARAAEGSGYVTKGGTGFGVRTLVSVIESFAR